MLSVMNFSPLLDTTLLNNILAIIISVVGCHFVGVVDAIATHSESSEIFSAFSGLTVQTNCPYVTSSRLECGTLSLLMNWIVLVGFLILPPTPLASRPNLLADDRLQSFF